MKITERSIYRTQSGKETPIAICKCEDERYRLVAGSNLLTTTDFDNKEDASDYLTGLDIELLGSICALFVDGLLEVREIEKAKQGKTMSKPSNNKVD